VIERWVAFWDRREGPESLGLARLLVALAVLVDLTGALSLGLVPDLWAPPPDGLGWVGLSADAPPFTRVFGASSGTALFLFVCAFAAALCVLAGIAFRPAAWVLALAGAELARLAPDGDRAVDSLLRIAVLVLAFSRADACFSLRALVRSRCGLARETEIPAWPRYLLFLQVVWVYFSAAHNRGGSAWWPSGDFAALAQVLSDPHYARFAPGWTSEVYPLTQAATALTMGFELGAPLLIPLTLLDRSSAGGRTGELVRGLRLRWVYLALGVALHVGILATLRLGIFSLGMLALYAVFLDPSEIRRVVAAVRAVAVRRGVL
jgi:hypothetical protein